MNLKLSGKYLENALSNADKGIKGYLEQKDGNPSDNALICSIIVSITYGMIMEYHNALQEELKKHNIDIGVLDFDEPT